MKDESQYGEAWKAEMMKNKKEWIVLVASKIGKENVAMQARIEELEKMVIGLDTILKAPKGCQYKTAYNESGELVAVFEVTGAASIINWTTPTRLAKLP